jgi:hypothetical protein
MNAEPHAHAHLLAPTFIACMGGWCAQRDHCGHYHAQFRGQPSERLCVPGRDGISDIADVRVMQRPKVIRIASQLETL